LAGFNLDTATSRTAGPFACFAASIRDMMEERLEERCLALAGSMRISVGESLWDSVIVSSIAFGWWYEEVAIRFFVSLGSQVVQDVARSMFRSSVVVAVACLEAKAMIRPGGF